MDDGSCVNLVTELQCLKRKSVFDTSVSYCKWTEGAPYQCSYREIAFTWKVRYIFFEFTHLLDAGYICSSCLHVPCHL